jgi:hypothetical protein
MPSPILAQFDEQMKEFDGKFELYEPQDIYEQDRYEGGWGWANDKVKSFFRASLAAILEAMKEGEDGEIIGVTTSDPADLHYANGWNRAKSKTVALLDQAIKELTK